MGLTLWFRCPVEGCSYKRAHRLEAGEAGDQSAFAKRDATLCEEHPNHPTTGVADRDTEETVVTGTPAGRR